MHFIKLFYKQNTGRKLPFHICLLVLQDTEFVRCFKQGRAQNSKYLSKYFYQRACFLMAGDHT